MIYGKLLDLDINTSNYTREPFEAPAPANFKPTAKWFYPIPQPSVPSESGTLSPPPPTSPTSSADTPPIPASADHARLSVPGVPSAPERPDVPWDIWPESGRPHGTHSRFRTLCLGAYPLIS